MTSNAGFSHSDLVADETIGVLVVFRQPACAEFPRSKFISFGEWIELACVVVFFAFLTGLEVRVLLRVRAHSRQVAVVPGPGAGRR